MQASPEMQKVVEELATKHGADLSVPGAWMRLELPHFDRLVVEAIGVRRISVAHYWELEHDLIPAPEIVFAVEGECWYPISIEQGFTGFSLVARKVDGAWFGQRDGQAGVAAFADEWATNIREQGWIDRAELARVERGDGRKAA